MSYVNPSCNLFVRNFSAGYLDTPEPDVLDPGATPDAKNAVFVRIGADPLRVTMGKRLGHRLVMPYALSTPGIGIDGLFEYRRAGAPNLLLAVTDGHLIQILDNATVAYLSSLTYHLGGPARGLNINNQAVIMDGYAMERVQAVGGSSTLAAYPVGFAAPTGPPGLGAWPGPGPTGTYEGFAVWYDQTTDHESSPSPISAPVVLVNQVRVWTKPAGTYPASVTHWRVYARRVDINEVNYYRTGMFAITATSGSEGTSDLARTNIGPAPHANDPPPGPFAFMASYRGYAIGVLRDGTDLYFSSQADFQSWNPSDVLRVNFGRQEIRSVKVVGENCLVQTPTMSFRLEGDRMPFRIVNLHSTFGVVSHDAGTEVEGWLYGWDEGKGPYRVSRDFGTWQPLADNRIERLVHQVNREALESIICVHDQVRHLVLWAFPLGTSLRKRTVIGFDYTLETWTAPMTGLEYSAWTPYTTTAGVKALYVGDAWGRIFEMFSGTRDGIPAGPSTVVATVTAAGTSSVVADGASFFTVDDGLMGLPVAVVSPTGQWQWRRIQSNTATTISLDVTNDNPWITVPQPGWTVIVGGIEWYWTSPWLDFGRPDRFKRGSWLTVLAKTAGEATAINVTGKFDNEVGTGALHYNFPVPGSAGVWGVGIWGQSLWSSSPQVAKKLRVGRTFLTTQIRFQNFYPDQTVDITGYGVEGDWLPRRRTR